MKPRTEFQAQTECKMRSSDATTYLTTNPQTEPLAKANEAVIEAIEIGPSHPNRALGAATCGGYWAVFGEPPLCMVRQPAGRTWRQGCLVSFAPVRRVSLSGRVCAWCRDRRLGSLDSPKASDR